VSSDPDLARIVRSARELLISLDPVGARLRGEQPQPRLPPAGPDAHLAGIAGLERLLADLADLDGELSAQDRLDRLVLTAGLRRALPPRAPRAPTGVVVLERRILAALIELEERPQEVGEELSLIGEAGPAYLAESREGCKGCAPAECEVALAAGKRIPMLLDLVAAGASASRVERGLRERLEAALGPLLVAAAEDTGFILKQLMPAAVARPLPPDVDGHLDAIGFSLTVAEIEAEAEEALAWAVAVRAVQPVAIPARDAMARDDADAPPVERGKREMAWVATASPHEATAEDGPVPLTVERVGAMWARVAAASAELCLAPGDVPVRIEQAPAWLGTLVPDIAIADTGPRRQGPIRLLVATGLPRPEAELERALTQLFLVEFLPAAWQRSAGREARWLLPSPDAMLGWRALVIEGRDDQDSVAETAWRAVVTLAGAGILRGRLDRDGAADLIGMETGMEPARAREQADHIAANPTAALSWATGRRRVRELLAGGGAGWRAQLLRAMPLPAAGVAQLMGEGDPIP
jgi:hypothetical protein